ncbi:MAG: ribosome maturation factor RimM [Anaerosomatales bacterium]|nr:ribosome maturation factor RimM [Anaerosomatales bacterium]
MDAPYIAIGRIIKAHGLRGEVSVKQLTDLPLDASCGIPLFVTPPHPALQATTILSVRQGPKGPLVSLDGVDSIGLAAELVDRSLMARAEEVPVSDSGPDVTGWAVVDVERGPIGAIADTIVTGANDVWVLAGGPYGEVLVPVITDVVLDLDDEARTIRVRLLPGLLPEETS